MWDLLVKLANSNPPINANVIEIIFPNLHYPSCAIISKNHLPIAIWKIEDEFLNKKIVNIFPSDNGLFTSITQNIAGIQTPTLSTHDKNCGAQK